ncbi:MAG: translation initiation factor IF-2 subunit alpha [Desulfurococcales archaeon]|nr:translation initiation factor IF-2 subunit alpha [Desulfurococcales archaeon]
MPLKPRTPLPSVGELVVGTITDIKDYGAYLKLDEYDNLPAFLPWSEIGARLMRNFNNLYHTGDKIVVKVIRVNRRKMQVDVSLKKVMEGEKRRKMMQFKRRVKATTLVTMVAEKIGANIDEAYQEVIWPLEDHYGDLMTALEYAVIEGPEALKQAGIPERWIEPLYETAVKHVEVKQVKISGMLEIRSLAPDGVERIKKLLTSIMKYSSKRDGSVTVKVYTIGAPKYRIDLTGYDYKTLEAALSKALKRAEKEAKKLGLEFNFARIKEK